MGDSGNVSASASADAAQTNMTTASSAAGADPSSGFPSQSSPPSGAANPGGNWGAMLLTTVGGIGSAISQRDAGKTNASIAGANAVTAQAQAQEEINKGAFDANLATVRGRQLASAQRAGAAGSGVVAGAGGEAAIVGSTDQMTSMDRMLIERNAARRALGYTSQADSDLMQGEAAKSKGDLGAFSTLLSTGAQDWLESESTYRGYHGSGVGLGAG